MYNSQVQYILYILGQITIKADSNPIFIIQYKGNNVI